MEIITRKYLWTRLGYRLNLIATHPSIPVHWLFLPGGPGLGSEYLYELAVNLKLNGVSWLIDFPGDGSNRTAHTVSENEWIKGLIDLVHTMQPCVLVAHSFGGMFALSIPEIEQYLSGLVLINTAPSNAWINQLREKLNPSIFSNIENTQKNYLGNKNDHTFKDMTMASSKLFFEPESLQQGEVILKSLPFNHTYYDWAQENFHPHFTYRWIPKTIPTMIIGSERDSLCPIDLFLNEKAFVRNNITIHSIHKAGHFSWINAFTEISRLFLNYTDQVKSFVGI